MVKQIIVWYDDKFTPYCDLMQRFKRELLPELSHVLRGKQTRHLYIDRVI